MNSDVVVDIFKNAISTVITVTVPILGIAMAVGLIIAIFQATTQINEQTMVFAPKIIAIFLGLIFLGPWILNKLTAFAENLFGNILSFI